MKKSKKLKGGEFGKDILANLNCATSLNAKASRSLFFSDFLSFLFSCCRVGSGGMG